MRASERKGAWALMAGIVLLGFMLWIFGKCRNAPDSSGVNGEGGSSKIEMRELIADSADNSGTNGHKRRARNKKQRKGEGEKASVKQKKRGKQSKSKIPIRDILADTIQTQSRSKQSD